MVTARQPKRPGRSSRPNAAPAGRSGRAAPASRGVAKAAGARAGKPVAKATSKSGKPMSIAAQKAVAAKLERQRDRSDAGRARSASRSSRPPRPDEGPRRTSDRGLGGEQVEGRQAVRELLLAGRRKIREIWVATDLEDAGVISDIVDLAAEQRVPVVEVNRKRLDAAARSESPQGVLARAAELEEAELDDLLRSVKGRPAPFILALDGVTDPGNLGAVLRSAEGAGVTGVVLPRHRAVHITPTAAKAAAGAVEHLPIAVVSGLPMAMQKARQAKLWILGLDDAADRSLFDIDDLGREPVMLVLGAEGAGLSRLVRERCDLVVSIPMAGRLGSLNVSSAGALACYEIARQRARK